MKCIKCKCDIPDGAAFCQHCGSRQNLGVLDQLKAYPNIYRSLIDTYNLIKAGNYTASAIAMRRTLEEMVEEIYSKCRHPERADLCSKINMLNNKQCISSISYERYTTIRVFGNQHAHGGSAPATKEAAEMHLQLLLTEIGTFINTYSKIDYSGVTLEDSKNWMTVVSNIVARLIGAIFMCLGICFMIMGIFFVYDGASNDFFPQSGFGIFFAFVGLVFTLIGLAVLIGGKKMLKILSFFRYPRF